MLMPLTVDVHSAYYGARTALVDASGAWVRLGFGLGDRSRLLMRATLFDFNGVLVDDEHVHLEAFREVLAPRGVVVTDADYAEKYLGFDDVGAFRAILEGRRPRGDRRRGRRARSTAKTPAYFRASRRRSASSPAQPSWSLAAAPTRASVGIVSGALRPEIEHALASMGVAERVTFIVSAEDTRACKPDPEGFVLGRARVPEGARVVVIEDSRGGRPGREGGRACAAWP